MSKSFLKEGEYLKKELSDEEIFRSFKALFEKTLQKDTSYVFVFLKTILDCKNISEESLSIDFDTLFESFANIYWSLIINYGIKQKAVSFYNKGSYVEQILFNAFNESHVDADSSFYSLPEDIRLSAIKEIKQKCKAGVLTALYTDTECIMYSFSLKDEILTLNPCVYNFLQKNKRTINRLNCTALAEFYEKINAADTDYLKEKFYLTKDSYGFKVYINVLMDLFM